MVRNNPSAEEGLRENRRNVTYEQLIEKYDIRKKYRHPNSYSEEGSYYGSGKYPPDWGKDREDISDTTGGRREAVSEYQEGECARCKRSLDEHGYHCHHYTELSEGGTNELQNLIGLCADCHKLIHPENDGLSGNWKNAPFLPSRDADRRVATIRKPVSSSEEKYSLGLRLLEISSTPGQNESSTSDATYSLSPTDALDAREDLEQMLDNRGLKPTGRAVIEAFEADGSPAANQRVETELYFDNRRYESIKVERETNEQGRVDVLLPEHNVAYARLYNTQGEQVADTKLRETSDGWEATLSPSTGDREAITTGTTSNVGDTTDGAGTVTNDEQVSSTRSNRGTADTATVSEPVSSAHPTRSPEQESSRTFPGIEGIVAGLFGISVFGIATLFLSALYILSISTLFGSGAGTLDKIVSVILLLGFAITSLIRPKTAWMFFGVSAVIWTGILGYFIVFTDNVSPTLVEGLQVFMVLWSPPVVLAFLNRRARS